ncbi:Rap1a/Tai family immunity protein [Phreatobacter stygius]|uniref:Rap1a immunity protein domain-containing protein n=1 Tax=Phreatobacter stygius TaxID=1940610 RepID=A0A4D7B2X0_9HYPH|nr:Rap1a/Tai family immunity protein [Phreatobacter stygius]QCI67201.1 hypothetical protein E8M01_24985 [Phreatobacter stygius]
MTTAISRIGASVLVCLALAGAIGQAEANQTASQFLTSFRARDARSVSFLVGLTEGFGWANAQLRASNQRMLFCAPRDVGFTPLQHADILAAYLRRQPRRSDVDVGLVMLAALAEQFPCR